MKFNGRSVIAMLLLFTVVAVGMLWGLSQRLQKELRGEVIARAEQRSEQLADAMAGQVAAELALMDNTLLSVRDAWLQDPSGYEALVAQKLKNLPEGLVVLLGQLSAEGLMVFNSKGNGYGMDFSNVPHFKVLKEGPDRMVIGSPLMGRVAKEWLIPVGRPLYRNGQFAGSVYLLLSAQRLAQRLGRLTLAQEDVVGLVHPNGQILALSSDNSSATALTLSDRNPFLHEGSAASGTYRMRGAVDKVPRVFGWHRLPGSGAVMVVGLAESSVLAPLRASMTRSNWLTGALSAVLLLGGLLVAWLLWRVERGGEAMRESAQRLEDAQRLAKVGHWSLDLRTRTFTWSDEVYRIFDLQRGASGLTLDELSQRVPPEDRAGFDEQFEGVINAGVRLNIAHRILLPDGRIKHIHALGQFEVENGVPVRCLGTVQDITEVRSAQLALQTMNNELEARVEARTRELGELNNELEAFAYSVSHDLRTPLRSIHGFATLLEEESEQLSAEGRSHLRRIQDGARRMGLLITDLLTMAHQSRAVVKSQRVNLSELAQAVALDIEREDPQRKVVWQIEQGLWIWADLALMRVVLQNLLGNAWKYSQQTEQAEISLQRVGQSAGMTEYCVRDNGAGFDMAYVDQLFQPFKRLHAHHEFEGSGVGLASVQRLVQRHGGTVRAEGAVGKGAAIYFSLPDAPVGSQDRVN